MARGTRRRQEEKEPFCDYSSTHGATLPRTRLSCGIKEWPRSAAALTPPASCLLLLPFWSLSKGTFLVMCWLRNQPLVTQELEFTMKFRSMQAAFKVTEFENNRSSIQS